MGTINGARPHFLLLGFDSSNPPYSWRGMNDLLGFDSSYKEIAH
jgi:hypothetical protein